MAQNASQLIRSIIRQQYGLCKSENFYKLWISLLPTEVVSDIKHFTPDQDIGWINNAFRKLLESFDNTTEVRLWLEDHECSEAYADSFCENVFPELINLGVI
jgi:hypothetical protein